MPPENINEAVNSVTEAAHETAVEVIEQANDSAQEIHENASEAVIIAAQAVAESGEQINDMQKELEWKLATQNQLTELQTKIAELTATHQQIPEHLTAMEARLMEKLTPPILPPPESEAALLEAQNALQPEPQAEPQPEKKPNKKATGRNWV